MIREAQDDLATIMTLEQGKPLAEAKGEIAYAASLVKWYAEEGKRVYGETVPSPISDRRVLVQKQPVGGAEKGIDGSEPKRREQRHRLK